MTKQVQRRRGTATQHTSFTGAEGEISVNTTNKSVHVHDGSTAGGIEAARADLTNVADADLNTALSGNTLASLTITSADINGGSIDGTTIGANSAAAITGTTITGTSFVSSGNMTFGDNDKAIFGAGSDLQIYHDGSNGRSYIVESGSSNLYIAGENLRMTNTAGDEFYLLADANGEVSLRHNNSEKLATTSTGIDVTGTVTADSLAVNGIVRIDENDPQIRLLEDDTTDLNSQIRVQGGVLDFRTLNDAEDTADKRLSIDNSTGDISFYEDTGTTAKFFWDASAESLGIGTTSPSTDLDIEAFRPRIEIKNTDTGGGTYRFVVGDASDANYLAVYDTGASQERLRIDSSGNVGIGTTSPSTYGNLALYGNGTNKTLAIIEGSNSPANNDTYGSLAFGGRTDGTITAKISGLAGNNTNGTDGQLAFYTADNTAGSGTLAERMRIDSSGNLLVGGTTSPSGSGQIVATGGVYLGGTGSANKLDDYETGTWTPVYTSSGTNPTFTPNLQNGVYTKVGRLVYASFRIRGAITGTKTGNLQISGLPFANNNSPATGSGAVRFTEDFGANKYPTGLGVQQSGTYINLTTFDSDSARNQQFTAVDVASTSASSSGNYIIGHVVYQTD